MVASACRLNCGVKVSSGLGSPHLQYSTPLDEAILILLLIMLQVKCSSVASMIVRTARSLVVVHARGSSSPGGNVIDRPTISPDITKR